MISNAGGCVQFENTTRCFYLKITIITVQRVNALIYVTCNTQVYNTYIHTYMHMSLFSDFPELRNN